ncbi:MAG TPA: SMI1/KNR4 family protein [Xanthomonadales bacterium]|nr:SMI1/KNR4 family protein [Xanthomonadales bacterium]
MEAPGVLELVGDALEGQQNRVAAQDRSVEELIADLVALTEDPEAGPATSDDAAIQAAEKRLGVELPEELERVLRTQHAAAALGWHATEEFERADALGDELGKLLRVEGAAWRDAELLVEDLDGGSAAFPAGDLRSYLVLGRGILGDVILYDASASPKHACCRVIETPVIQDDTPTAYRDLHDWIATTWALQRAVD